MPSPLESALQFVAFARQDGPTWAFEFPDAPGCVGTAETLADVSTNASGVLERWLRSQLDSGVRPAWPKMHRVPRADEQRVHVTISPSLAVAVQLRVLRHDRAWSQAELAKRVGVSQQQIANLENPDGNPTMASIRRVAEVFDRPLVVVFGKDQSHQ